MRRQTEIVVRRKIDARRAAAACAAGRPSLESSAQPRSNARARALVSRPALRRRLQLLIPSLSNSRGRRRRAGIRRRQQPSPRNTEFAPARKHSACASSRQRQPSRAEAHEGRRHQDARGRDRPHQLERILGRPIAERRAFDADQQVDRHALRVRIERRQLLQHAVARPSRSSPMPMMPPQQTVMPALRTRASVSSRSS